MRHNNNNSNHIVCIKSLIAMQYEMSIDLVQ